MPVRDPGDPTDPSGRSGRPVAGASPAPAAPPPAAPAPTRPYTPYRPPAPSAPPAPTSMPAGGWGSWRDVPTGEQNALAGMIDIWEQSTGYRVPITSDQMLQMVNGGVETLHDIGQFVATSLSGPFASVLATMPWAQY